MRRFEQSQASSGFSLAELLVAVAVLGLLTSLAIDGGQRSLARMRVEAASRRLGVGLEAARRQAQSHGQPCALELGASGWSEPSGGSLAGCLAAVVASSEQQDSDAVTLQHNLPGALRFSSNGLILDGGTVVIAAPGTELRRCLVVSLPLGVSRLGRYTGPLDGPPSSSACLADGAL
ncbi:hypothetical protein OGCDGJMD_01988 [Cyanobium usitatum str. Tous]|jgi:prepilin-type N-terminal cleavage/methylation domain-containing protein|nr:hypothetical protein OGCDGJMD_01988 [Cyanobium usitatum str. Tous]